MAEPEPPTVPGAPNAARMIPPDALAAALRQHPCLQEAFAQVGADGRGVTAWVVPEPASVRVPVRGDCLLIDDAGEEFPAVLCDVSFDGLSVRVVGDQIPGIGARVQANVEAEGLGGGVEGWLGMVCWQRDRELGIAFDRNWDERGAVVRLVHDCAGRRPATPAPAAFDGVGRCPRVAVDLPCTVHTAAGERLALRTVDLSASGVGLAVGPDAAAAVTPALHGQGVDVELRIPGGEAHPLRGVIVREHADFLAIAFEPDAAARDWLQRLVDLSIRTRSVSSHVLSHWLAHEIGEPAAANVRLVVVDALPREARSGAVDVSRLPQPITPGG